MPRLMVQDEKIVEAAKSYRAAAALEKEAKEYVKESRQILLEFMEDNGMIIMQAGNSLVKATDVVSLRFDTVRFRRDYPELASEYMTEVHSTRLTVTEA